MKPQNKLASIAKYNPQFWDDEEIRTFFIARKPQLNLLVQALEEEPGGCPPQHHLVVGQRGSGKSTLLKRLAVAVTDRPILGATWVPLSFPEEQYNISGLHKFWLNCLDALGDHLEKSGEHEAAFALDNTIQQLDNTNAATILQALLDEANTRNCKFLLLVDNLDMVLNRIGEEAWALREVLQSSAPLTVIGASASVMEVTFNYDAPFYDFFRIHQLKGLTLDETKDVLCALADIADVPEVRKIVETDPARLATMHQLSGGNPRTVVLLFNVFRNQSGGDVLADLMGLLDDVTPLYKARFEELAEQSQQVLDALALNWHPILAGDLAAVLQLKVNTVSTQLNRLEKQGFVEAVSSAGKRQAYQVAERFFNVWYLMRASRRLRQKLLWLVQFLKIFYTPNQLQDHARQLLDSNTQQAEYLVAVAQSMDSEHSALRIKLEHNAISQLMSNTNHSPIHELLDLEGTDKHLEPVVDRLQLRNEILNLQIPKLNTAKQEEFRTALLESASLTGDEKRNIIRTASELTNETVDDFVTNYSAIKSNLLERFGEQIHCFFLAMREGLCTSLDDIEGIQFASERLELPWLNVLVYWNIAVTSSKEEAEIAYRKAIALDGELAFLWVDLGNLLQDYLYRYEESEQAYRKAIEIDENDAYTWSGLGNVLQYHLGRYEESEQAYRKAIEIDESFAYPWSGLGAVLLHHLDRYEESEQAYRKAIEINENDAYTWSGLGNVLQHHLGRYEESEQAYRKAIEIDENFAYPWSGLGSVLQHHLGRYEESEQAYRKAIEIDENDAYTWSGLGSVLQHHLGRYEESELAYRKAIAIDKNDAYAWVGLGYLLSNCLDRHDEAEHAYRQALRADKENSMYHNSLAWLLFLYKKQAKASLTSALEAVELAGDDPHNLHTLACCQMLAKQVSIVTTSKLLAYMNDSFIENNWQELIRLSAMHYAEGDGQEVLALLDSSSLAHRLAPMREALASLLDANPKYLNMVAPEIRQPAETIVQQLNSYVDWWREHKQGAIND